MASEIRCRISCKCKLGNCRWWTGKAITRVRQAAQDNLTIAQAADLVGKTRSSTAGVARRNGIKFGRKGKEKRGGAPAGNRNNPRIGDIGREQLERKRRNTRVL